MGLRWARRKHGSKKLIKKELDDAGSDKCHL